MDGSHVDRPTQRTYASSSAVAAAVLLAALTGSANSIHAQPPKRRVDPIPPAKTSGSTAKPPVREGTSTSAKSHAESRRSDTASSTHGTESGASNDGPNQQSRPRPLPESTPRASTTGSEKMIPLRPASFQGVTPGKTRASQVEAKLGPPVKREDRDGVSLWYYKEFGPFASVEVWIEQGIATAVVAKLAQPMAAGELATQLKLKRFRPVEVKDGSDVLGQVYPERGVLFTYVPGSSSPRKVLQIALEPLTAEPFWLRAEQTPRKQYRQILTDLEHARQLGWKDSEATWLEIELRAQLEQWPAADCLAQQVEPQTFSQRCLRVWLAAQAGRIDAALKEAQSLRENADKPLEVAQAEHLLGNLRAIGLDRDLPQAVKHQTEVVRQTRALMGERDRTARRAARRLAIHAHLALARAVAAGPFQDKTTVTVEWWREARELAEDQPVVQRDLDLQHAVVRATLEADAALEKPILATPYVSRLRALTNKMLEQNDDPLYRIAVRRDAAKGMMAAAVVFRKLGRFSLALETAQEARKLAASIPGDTLRDQYLLGCVEFTVGSIYAVYQKDHQKACRHYDRALAVFPKELPAPLQHETGEHGERLVSIGVSLWEVGRKREAIEWTERGAAWMERAAEHGLLPESALAVPYGNLSAMQKAMGNQDASEEYARKAAAIGDEPAKRR